MHIHKISSNFKEHKVFLEQNRKDPITGDTILQGDRVVFCAICKSVFLSDTWEYLEKQHCEQTETLIEFPEKSSKTNFTFKEKTIFYVFLPKKKNSINFFASKINRNMWQEKQGEMAQQNYILYRKPLLYILLPSIFLIGLSFCFFIGNPFPFVVALLFSLLIFFISEIEHHLRGTNLKTIHKKFLEDTFYMYKGGVGFSRKFGTQEFFLPSANIHSLMIHFYPSDIFIIEDIEGGKIQFPTSYLLIQNKEKTLKVLNTLSKNCTISLYIKKDNHSNFFYHLERIVREKNYNIKIYKS